ncbi:ComF family protein [Desulfonatronum lacustre]|uniref:ComF family protein n=1 Tax=Desulfonatronum lacustre TaxID=66849 RepID=UPI000A070388|nr:ComF family protein [Desulfonatronum lacustre]
MGEFSQAELGLSSLRHVAGRCRGVVADFFRSGFPALGRRCPVCGILADVDAPGGAGAWGDDSSGVFGVCAACRAELPQRTEGFCLRCGLIFRVSSEPATLCLDCRVAPPPWEDAFFYGPYEGRLKALVLRFKFQAQLGLGEVLHGLLRRSLEFRDVPGHDLIVPVPLHPRRLRGRGFNQSLELARGLAQDKFGGKSGGKFGGKFAGRYGRLEPHALVRLRDTPPQHTLPRAVRRRNLAGAFLADPARVRGRSVLLVDDILTTGATVRAATRELKRCGATRVDLLVLARA